jgi:hypothetical protein
MPSTVAFFPRLRELVGLNGARSREALLQERFVYVVRDDRGTIRGEGAEAAGVVEVVMRVDHVFDRLVRHQLLDLGRYQTPSATLSAVTFTLAWRTLSGI